MQETADMTPAERIAQLESAMAEMAAKMDAVMSDNERLASLVSSMESGIAAVAAERDAAIAERDRVVSQILLANARAYGSRSERVLPHQLGLFNDMEAAFEPSAPEPAADEVARPRKKRELYRFHLRGAFRKQDDAGGHRAHRG